METAEKIDTPGKSHKILNAKHKIYKISIVINTGNGNQRIAINYKSHGKRDIPKAVWLAKDRAILFYADI